MRLARYYYFLHDQQKSRSIYPPYQEWGESFTTHCVMVRQSARTHPEEWMDYSKFQAAMTTRALSNSEFSFQTFLERRKRVIIFFFHGDLVLRAQEDISLANDGFWMTEAGSLTRSLHSSSKPLDICLWVETGRLSHCSTISDLVTHLKLHHYSYLTVKQRNRHKVSVWRGGVYCAILILIC